MKTKTLKIAVTLLIATFMIATLAGTVFAASGITVDEKIEVPAGLKTAAGQVLGAIRAISIVLAVILTAVFGFKFILGSAEEKAGYQKSFIPLIVGLVVVFSATTIADLILAAVGQ